MNITEQFQELNILDYGESLDKVIDIIRHLQHIDVWKRLKAPRKSVLVNLAYLDSLESITDNHPLLMALEREEWVLASNELKSDSYFKKPKLYKVLVEQLVSGEWKKSPD